MLCLTIPWSVIITVVQVQGVTCDQVESNVWQVLEQQEVGTVVEISHSLCLQCWWMNEDKPDDQVHLTW